jgi:FlaA1/EpsC-like NDP-sugar epimerase
LSAFQRCFSSEEHAKAYIAHARSLTEDRWSDLPMWVRANPGDALRDKRIIICGSQCKGEIRFAAKHFDVLGIVDDYQSGKTDLILGLPVLTTDDWIASVKRDPSIVTMILVWSSAGYNHFKRCCAQHDIAHLNMLEFLRVSAAAGLPPAGGRASQMRRVARRRLLEVHVLQRAELPADGKSKYSIAMCSWA